MSQFDGLLDLKKEKKVAKKEKPKVTKKRLLPTPKKKDKQKNEALGKSANQDYTQTSIYIKKDTQISVKSTLLTDTKKRDFSDLVEQLLTEWLNKK